MQTYVISFHIQAYLCIFFSYDKFKQEFAKNPHEMDDNILNENDDPLSQSSQVY